MPRKSAAILLSGFLSTLGLSGGRSQVTPEQAFWNWFQKNNDALFDFEKDQEQTFDRLSTELHKINVSLTFEFGPKENGRREFTISADGDRKAFPAVEKLCDAAPTMPRWIIHKFRQRHEPTNISYRGVRIKAEDVKAFLTKDGQKASITIYIPGYSEAARETYLGIAFLLLDQALGEYDVETRVGEISVKEVSQASVQACSFKDLPKRFDGLFAERN